MSEFLNVLNILLVIFGSGVSVKVTPFLFFEMGKILFALISENMFFLSFASFEIFNSNVDCALEMSKY